MKRKYREVLSSTGEVEEEADILVVKHNNWFRRNISLTGLYCHFSNYGESILKPTIIGIITIGISTLFWLHRVTHHFNLVFRKTMLFLRT